jgi:hypothetical protein
LPSRRQQEGKLNALGVTKAAAIVGKPASANVTKAIARRIRNYPTLPFIMFARYVHEQQVKVK